ncbi:MarR family winged helix-turn-helix transcriptional regulator [Sediminicoccus sp. KRV36]|uniref:MarR family winged helix-turn-helix transcriptional regulator n=1 Tax=Sediminicoccus sp. KRV36 TaxID=3133721 RepID=UPI00200DB62A|nr:MarR family winged helix-turn-helix transcriptional regulator [Sediminicoccus rosea]UPY37398.1 MarR family winged helix-turn-helix transcriptional regulator [Sediminicoccus rosea]
MPDSPIFALLNEIGIIEQLARNRFERLQPDGLRLPQFTVLNHLVRLGDGRGPAQIARAFEVSKATMTNTLQRLEERGFIRLDPDPADARGKRVMLTEAGRARREAAIALVTADLAPVASHLGAPPESLLPALRRLREALDQARNA